MQMQSPFDRPDILIQTILLFLAAVPVLMLPIFLLYYSSNKRFGRALRHALWAAFVGETLVLLRPDLRLAIGDFTRDFYFRQPGLIQRLVPCLFVLGVAVFALPLGVMVYEKILRGSLTDAERQGGAAGVRAWLSGWNLTWAAGTAFFAWLAYDYPFWIVLLLLLLLLVAYPVLIRISAAAGAADGDAPRPASPKRAEAILEDVSEERARVLKLLEEGKINAEECGELLSALSESARAIANVRPPLSPARKLAFAGLGLVMIGFLLPWFVLDINKLMGQAGQQLNENMNQMLRDLPNGPRPGEFPGLPEDFQFKINAPGINNGVLQVTGGEAEKGLGWVILFLAILAAFVPLITNRIPPRTQRLIGLALLGIGALFVFSLLSQHYRYVGIGFVAVMVGYALELAGVAKDRTANE